MRKISAVLVAGALAVGSLVVATPTAAAAAEQAASCDVFAKVINETVDVVMAGNVRSCPTTSASKTGSVGKGLHAVVGETVGGYACPGNGQCSNIWYSWGSNWFNAALTGNPCGFRPYLNGTDCVTP